MSHIGAASQRMEGSTTKPGQGGGLGGWTARALAVLAVAAAAIALIVVVSGSLSSSTDGGAGQQAQGQGQGKSKPKEKPEDTYVVQPGDTLGGVAARFDVPIDRLERLNPDIDPQALPAGVTLRLRR